MRAFVLLLFLFGLNPSQASDFKYHLVMRPEGYRLSMDMDFGPAVSLSQVIFNLNDPSLFPRLNSAMLPSAISHRPGGTSEMITSFKVLGWKAHMLFNCNEQFDKNSYHRQCVLDVPRLNAALFMDSKSDELTCAKNGDGPVHCHFDVAGKIKSVLFLKSETLTLKAKSQALLNWEKFWYFTALGSSSVRYSDELFSQSELKKDLDDFMSGGLKETERDRKFSQRDIPNP
jgi:hypothetical protein